MRILITGAFGFLGGRLASFLSSGGNEVILGSRKLNIPPSWLPDAEIVQLKWDDFSELKLACRNVDMIIHAAGVNAFDAENDPIQALSFNGVCTARLVNAACSAKVKKFLYLSTAHVYAKPLVGVISENTLATNLHPYATSHFSGEQAVLSASQFNDIEGIVLRISNVFGWPMSKSVNCWMLLVNNLCRQAVEDQKLVIKGNILEERNFIPMNEFCKIFSKLTMIQSKNLNGVFNIGTDQTQTLFDMADKVQKRCVEKFGYKPDLIFDNHLKKEITAPLVFRSERLKELGINVDGSYETEEIDRLLEFCSLSFMQKNIQP